MGSCILNSRCVSHSLCCLSSPILSFHDFNSKFDALHQNLYQMQNVHLNLAKLKTKQTEQPNRIEIEFWFGELHSLSTEASVFIQSLILYIDISQNNRQLMSNANANWMANRWFWWIAVDLMQLPWRWMGLYEIIFFPFYRLAYGKMIEIFLSTVKMEQCRLKKLHHDLTKAKGKSWGLVPFTP